MTAEKIHMGDAAHPCGSATLGDMATSTSPINFDHLFTGDRKPKPFQTVGMAYALFQTQDGKGCFIADEMGLGKSIQGIGTAVLHAKAHSLAPKFLFVVKASLKANMEREINLAFPDLTTQVLGGNRPYEITAQVAIISYNLLSKWQTALSTEGFTALVIDESHNVKDPKAQQTKAALKIAAAVRQAKGLVLLLTGTPLLNRPVELVAQLMMIGRLEDVTPRPKAPYGAPADWQPTERDWEFSFKFTYCGATKNSYGKWEFKGASRLDRLNSLLRNRCYIRRLRKDVLDMQETQRQHIPLSLNGDLDRYWDVEKNFTGSGDPRSFVIELLGALRKTVASCKINATVDWIQDEFLADNPGKKLVVWADHVEAQREIAAALNAAGIKTIHLMAEQERGRLEAAKAEFNQGDAQVLVCSIKAHGFGHTFTGNGHNVTDCLFHEQPWHPGAVMQCEDRINRIGQEADVVFAHTLIAPGTVDTWLEDLIAGKWETFKAAADGSIAEWQEDEIFKAVQAKLLAHLLAKYGESRLPEGVIA